MLTESREYLHFRKEPNPQETVMLVSTMIYHLRPILNLTELEE